IAPEALVAFNLQKCRWPAGAPAADQVLCWALEGRRDGASPIAALLLLRADGGGFPAQGKLQPRKCHGVGGSRDSWIWPGGRDALQRASVIVKVEGPTDALALWPLLPHDWLVVTNATGASANPGRLPTEFAAGKAVYVVGDADKAGQSGAGRFARAF